MWHSPVAGTVSDEEDMGWGEQAQIAVDRELNPPKGPGGNPKIDRRSTTGSNFMRCLPDQAPAPIQFTSDRTPFLGGFAALAPPRCRRRRSKSGMQLCRAGRNESAGWAEAVGADGSGGCADGSRRSWVDVMLMSRADGSGGAAGGSGELCKDSMLVSHVSGLESAADGGSWGYQDSTLMSHSNESVGGADVSEGSHMGSQAHVASWMTNGSHSQMDGCSRRCNGQNSSFLERCLGLGTISHRACALNSRTPTGAPASPHSMTISPTCGFCDTSCGCSQYSSSGRSCIGSCCIHRCMCHDRFVRVGHDRMAALRSSLGRQQARHWTQLCKARVCSCVSHVAGVPARVQKQLHSRTVLSSSLTAGSGQKAVQGFSVSFARQRQLASRPWL